MSDYRYLISGFLVSADFPLAGAQAVFAATPSADPDIAVSRAPVSIDLGPDAEAGPTWSIAARSVALSIPGLLRMRVDDGRSIRIEPAPGVPDADLSPFALSTGMGIALHQRAVLALHAATVAFADRGIAICGLAGAGKSTLAAALCEAGATFVGDDIAAVRFTDGLPVAFPDGRDMRLWQDAVDALGLTARRGSAVREAVDKYHVSAGQGGRPVPLAAVVVLRERSRRQCEARPDLRRLAAADAAAALMRQRYRPGLARRLRGAEDLFRETSALLGQVPVFELERTPGLEHLPAAVAALRDAFHGNR